MLRFLLTLGAGYVLGTKAGRKRYNQISRGAQAIATSPATKKALGYGRQKLSDALSTEPKMREIKQLDADTTILEPDTDSKR